MDEIETNVKQIIVVRNDLNMRKGKIAAQVAHASMKAIFDLMHIHHDSIGYDRKYYEVKSLVVDKDSALDIWLNGLFTKIVVGVENEEELLSIYNKAKEEKMICSLIQDSGKTEFHNIPTYTCCAIGPDYSYNIAQITGHLKLL